GSAELYERELGAEAGPEGAQDALLATAQAAGADHLVEDEEHGDRAHVPMLAQDPLRGGEVLRGQPQLLAHHLDDAAAAGVEDPARDRRALQAARGQEPGHHLAHVLAHERGQLAVQDDLQPLVAQVEAHEFRRAREEHALRAEDARLARTAGLSARMAAPGQDDRRAAVAEDRGGDDVGGGVIPALEGEAGELEGEDYRHLVGVGDQEVVRAGQPDHASRTSRFRDGEADQARSHAQRVRDVGVHGRDLEAGARHADDQADVLGSDLRGGEGTPYEGRSLAAGDVTVDIVLGLEVAGMEDLLYGDDAGAGGDSGGGIDGEEAASGFVVAEPIADPARDFLLGVPVRRFEPLDGQEGCHGSSIAPNLRAGGPTVSGDFTSPGAVGG